MTAQGADGRFVRTFEPDEADILARRKAGETLASIGASYGVSASAISKFCKCVKARKATEAKERRAARERDAAAQPERAGTQPVPAPDTPELTSVVRRRDGSASLTVAGKGPLRISPAVDDLEAEMNLRGYVRVTNRFSMFQRRDGW